MREVQQTILYPPSGNCLAACVASLLELGIDDVPNFSEMDDWREQPDGSWKDKDGHGLGWWNGLAEFASGHGYSVLNLIHGSGGWGMKGPTGALGIASIHSPRGDYLHAVVAIVDGRVAWDPYPNGYQIGHQLTDDDIVDWLFLVRTPS